MKLPKLKEGYNWEITRTGVKVWRMLPDEVVYDSCEAFTLFNGDKQFDRETVGDKIRLYNRREVVFEEEVDWGSTTDAYGLLDALKNRWEKREENLSKIEFGYKG